MPKTRAEYLEMVKGPGKFEGEAAYVPYFWEQYCEGFADRDDGNILGFDVHDDDRKIFPELKGRRTVNLRELDTGFVVELTHQSRCRVSLKVKPLTSRIFGSNIATVAKGSSMSRPVFIIIQDKPNGERLYWNDDVCWVEGRDSATEYGERPHTIPHGSKVFEFDRDDL